MKQEEIQEAYQEIIKAQQSTIDSLIEVIKAQGETLAKYMGVQI